MRPYFEKKTSQSFFPWIEKHEYKKKGQQLLWGIVRPTPPLIHPSPSSLVW